MEKTPWCFVDDKSLDRSIEPCDIPKCVDKIWLSIIVTLGLIIATVVLISILLLKKKKCEMKNIQNVRILIETRVFYDIKFLFSSFRLTHLMLATIFMETLN